MFQLHSLAVCFDTCSTEPPKLHHQTGRRHKFVGTTTRVHGAECHLYFCCTKKPSSNCFHQLPIHVTTPTDAIMPALSQGKCLLFAQGTTTLREKHREQGIAVSGKSQLAAFPGGQAGRLGFYKSQHQSSKLVYSSSIP